MEEKMYYIKLQYILESVVDSIQNIDEELREVFITCKEHSPNSDPYNDNRYSKLNRIKYKLIDESIEKLNSVVMFKNGTKDRL